MKNIIKKINAMALTAMLIGGGLAYAASSSSKNSQLFRKDNNHEWTIPVTGQLGIDYNCSLPMEEECTAELNERGEPVNITPGKYE
jgi:hypothetical protein